MPALYHCLHTHIRTEIQLWSIRTLMRHPTQLAAVPTDISSILTSSSGWPSSPVAHALMLYGVLDNQQLLPANSLWLGEECVMGYIHHGLKFPLNVIESSSLFGCDVTTLHTLKNMY